MQFLGVFEHIRRHFIIAREGLGGAWAKRLHAGALITGTREEIRFEIQAPLEDDSKKLRAAVETIPAEHRAAGEAAQLRELIKHKILKRPIGRHAYGAVGDFGGAADDVEVTDGVTAGFRLGFAAGFFVDFFAGGFFPLCTDVACGVADDAADTEASEFVFDVDSVFVGVLEVLSSEPPCSLSGVPPCSAAPTIPPHHPIHTTMPMPINKRLMCPPL